MCAIVRTMKISKRQDAKRGAKGALSPGPLGLEGPFRYQNGYYLSVM